MRAPAPLWLELIAAVRAFGRRLWAMSRSRITPAVMAGCALVAAAAIHAQTPAATRLTPNLENNIERPLRYRPEHGDFVVENGGEFFNRPLYGGNTAFRVDAGDQPEFTLYLPGRGGNLRPGFRTPTGSKWLFEAARVTARYRPGGMIYEVRDPALGEGNALTVEAYALAVTEGLILRVEYVAGGGSPGVPVDLVWAYGGVNGQRGTRDGDIGTEPVPIGEYFQLEPEFCRGNEFAIDGSAFTLRSKPATIVGMAPPGSQLAVADATRWSSWERLLESSSATPELPVVIGRVALARGEPRLLALQRVAQLGMAAAFRQEELPWVFDEVRAHFKALRERVSIDTPDAYLNAAAGALNVAADAAWDEPQSAIMHGAVAWRSKLLGWRGPYLLDALGWHDRARRNFTYWATRQNTDPVADTLPPPDEKTNLARREDALHSNGDMSNSHYDMNLVHIDALFRHLLWTGDLEFARQEWPVIERHLAWERRLFRREFGPDRLPLYEAYAAIWASDDLEYSGGGTAHASAYNYYHNTMAARLARVLGLDATPYEREAELIAKAMREYLWLPDRGMFAEFKDYLGRQLVHPSAALWTFYHTIDSEVPTPAEAWRMADYVEAEIPHLPVRGPGVPADDRYQVLSSTNWMPYSWSINNVAMNENLHTALGLWQAGRPDEAFRLTKSSLLASMFMGVCPGNVGSMNYLDVYRRESQRDFADGSGVLSRAMVEGLFGVKPDALAGELRIAPGFPGRWDHASLRHPDVSVAFRREGHTDTYVIESRFARPMTVRLHIPSRLEDADVTVNGRAADFLRLDRHAPRSSIDVRSAPEPRIEVVVTWKGAPLQPATPDEHRQVRGRDVAMTVARSGEDFWRTPLPATARLEPVDLASHFNDRVSRIFKNEYRSPRSPFCSLSMPRQGIGAWAGHVDATAVIDDTGLRAVSGANGGRLMLPNGVPFATPGPDDAPNITFTSQWDNYPREATMRLAGKARRVFLLMAGSTNGMQSRLDNGEVVVTYAGGTTAQLALRNPETWWPIDQDYFVDDYQFRVDAPLPPRVDLRTGRVRILDRDTFKGQGRDTPGGAATVLILVLDPSRELQSLTVRTLANDVVIGLMAATLER